MENFSTGIKIPKEQSIKKIGNIFSTPPSTFLKIKKDKSVTDENLLKFFTNIDIEKAAQFGPLFEKAAKEFVKELTKTIYETIGRGVMEEFLKKAPPERRENVAEKLKPIFEKAEEERSEIFEKKWTRTIDNVRENFQETFGELKDKIVSDVHEVLGPELSVIFRTIRKAGESIFKPIKERMKKSLTTGTAFKAITPTGQIGEGESLKDYILLLLSSYISKYLPPIGKVLRFGAPVLAGAIGGLGAIGAGYGTGGVIGAAGGAAGGGILGSVIGSALGPVGTAAGFVIGSFIGEFLGRNVGNVIDQIINKVSSLSDIITNFDKKTSSSSLLEKFDDFFDSAAKKIVSWGETVEKWFDVAKTWTAEKTTRVYKDFSETLRDSTPVFDDLKNTLLDWLSTGAQALTDLLKTGVNKAYELASSAASKVTSAVTGGAGAGPEVSVKGTTKGLGMDERAAYLANLLYKELGLSKEAIAGLVGNIMVESEGLTTAVNKKSGAYGLVQWLGPRKKALFQYAQERGLSPESLEAQVGYLKKELESGEYKRLYEQMKAGGISPEDFASLVMNKFEKPSMEERAKTVGKRREWATKAFESIGKEVKLPEASEKIMSSNLAPAVNKALIDAVSNPTLGKNCGEQVTENINKGLEAAGGKILLPKENLGVGIPKFLSEEYGVPLLSKKKGEITVETLKQMGPGTAIGYTRMPGDYFYRPGADNTHAEMTAIYTGPPRKDIAQGELAIASKTAGRGILWKKIDEKYIERLPMNAIMANPFLSEKLGAQVSPKITPEGEGGFKIDMEELKANVRKYTEAIKSEGSPTALMPPRKISAKEPEFKIGLSEIKPKAGISESIKELETEKAKLEAKKEQEKIEVQKEIVSATKSIPEEVSTKIGTKQESQTNIIQNRIPGEREKQDLLAFDDPYTALLLMSVSALNA